MSDDTGCTSTPPHCAIGISVDELQEADVPDGSPQSASQTSDVTDPDTPTHNGAVLEEVAKWMMVSPRFADAVRKLVAEACAQPASLPSIPRGKQVIDPCSDRRINGEKRKRVEDQDGSTECSNEAKRPEYTERTDDLTFVKFAAKLQEEMNPNAAVQKNDKVIASAMVHDLYSIVEQMHKHCSVCAVLENDLRDDHASGKSCKTLPLDERTDPNWRQFKSKFILSAGLVCFRCLLPNNTTVPGGRRHVANDCDHRAMWLRPVLYAFWNMRTDEEEAFIRNNMNVPENVSFSGMESYIAWLVGKDKVYNMFNYLLLSWWLFVRVGWAPTILKDS